MRKNFSTGIAILLPIALTCIIVGFLVNFLTTPFLDAAQGMLAKLSLSLPSQDNIFTTFASKLVILVTLTLFISFVGLVGQLFLIDYCLKLGNTLLLHVPYINKIYKACQDVVHSAFSSSSSSFSHVVLVPYPSTDSLSLGFVAQDSLKLQKEDAFAVFVPGTPNPSVGFMLKFRKEELIFVDMKVEEAMKCVISCGTVMPDFRTIQPNDLP
ncbi:conserved putative membrane protein [Candidatus Protochlamydia naegleriophila]|uniref:Conserved putative membrane protein n=1 Tax=Candidatus Protochlamydia naegleriophila TaxID=389348 RepID=A0A0U5JAK4_9BACT|nr:DUF502 domain-containing protein [Candidatus Protochlamydia naegleriophila]CUI16462.1 conserved putative membrane protein [Candidatus Protochlamydia naegleriophila]